jgi:hypothetical protein
METYTIYTQCDHCGVYDRDTEWCTLCQKPKDAKRGKKSSTRATNPPRLALARQRIGFASRERGRI